MPSPTRLSVSTVPPKTKAAESYSGAVNLGGRYLAFVMIASIGALADLVTKYWVFQWRGMPGQRHVWWIWDGYIGIQTATNSGALFGIGEGYTWLFSSLSVIAIGGVFYWVFRAGGAHDLVLTIALGAILGGILGNLYDRLGLWECPGLQGVRLCHVRDWILLKYQHFHWPNFNIADCLLVGGALLLGWHSLRPNSVVASPRGDGTAEGM